MSSSLGEETLRLGDELDRLDEQLDEYAEKLADVESGTASARMLQQAANELDTQGGAVAALVEEYGPDATVTVRGLDAGGFARAEDRLAAMEAQADAPGGLPGSDRNVFAAVGLVDAPFYNGPSEGQSELDAKIAAVAGQPVGVAKWIHAKVNELTTVSEGNWKPLAERYGDNSTD